MKQLLMRWVPKEIKVPLPEEGYTLHQFHRGGDSVLTEAEYREGWIETVRLGRPYEMVHFERFYNDPHTTDDGFFVILDKEKTIVGVAMIMIGDHIRDAATLHMVVTRREHRGKKLGKIVTAAVMRYAYEKNFRELYLTTDDTRIPAIKTYLDLGFSPELYDTDMRGRWLSIMTRLNIFELPVRNEENKNDHLKRRVVEIFPEEGKNTTPQLVNALLNAENGTLITFKKGVYNFYSDEAYEDYFSPGCNRSSDKKTAFPLLNLNYITVDGNGSEFIFHNKMSPIIMKKSSGISLKNFSVDFSFEKCCIGKVGKVSETGISLLVDKDKYNYYFENGSLCFEEGGTKYLNSERRFTLRQYGKLHSFMATGKIFYNDNKNNLPSTVFFCDAKEIENGIELVYNDETVFKPEIEEGSDFKICFDTYRDNDVIFIDKCNDVSISDVRIFKGEGMGIVGQCCENLLLERFVIKPKTISPECYSTTADGVLLTNFSGKVTMNECVVSHNMDDAISVHGFYAKVSRIVSPYKVAARMQHLSQGGCNVFLRGDRIRISDAETMCETTWLKVVDSYIQDDPYEIYIEFNENILGKIKEGDFLENPERTPEVEIRNCLFENTHSIRIGSAAKVVFEENNLKSKHGVVVNDLLSFWHASGCVNDVTIKNNVFDGMPVGVCTMVGRAKESDVRHKNVLVTNNKFIDTDCALKAERTDNLLFKDNSFKNVKTQINAEDCTFL